MTRYVVIGMGVSGVAAVSTLRAADRGAEITLVGEDPNGFYSRPGLAYYLTDEIPEKQLTIYNKKDWEALNLRYVKARATRLDSANHRLEFGAADALTYDRLLIATGSTAVKLKTPGADLQGVVKLDDFQDARNIRSLARRAKTAVVIGGGVIAIELVEGLKAQGLQVHYFLRGDRYWSNVLDENESRFVERRLAEHGVIIHYQTEDAEIIGKRGRVTAVRTKHGEIVRCDLVAVGVGVRPRMELAQAAGLVTDRGILTDEYLQTSATDVFASGDVAQVLNPLTGVASLDTLWHPARQQGRVAALNMAGKRTAYALPAATNVLRLAGVMTTIIGAVGSGQDDDLVSVARGSSETWRQLPNTIAMESSTAVSHLRLMIGERSLVGAMVMGDQKLSLPLQELITAQTDISSIRAQLLEGPSELGEIVMCFWSDNKGSRSRA
jgi:NAD(P)H-nitrite reductase large subunit